jgi:hypothetical protein
MIKFDYTKTVERLYPQDSCPLTKVVSVLPESFGEAIISGKCWIAGGFIRRWYNTIKQDSDIDLFFSSKETFEKITEDLRKIALEPPLSSEFNLMFKVKVCDVVGEEPWIIQVQCIFHKYYTNVSELMDSFDFTICQFVYDGFNIYASENAVIDSQRKRLVPHKITYGASSLRRIIKYTKQGYYMCGGSAAEFLRQVGANEEKINSKVISID